MNITQVFQVNTTRHRAFAGLMDPETLRVSIPGCHSVEKDRDDTFDILVVLKMAGQKIQFKGSVVLEDVVPNNSFRAAGTVRIAGYGFTAANAHVLLRDQSGGAPPGTTLVDATVTVNISGKIAFLGERIITRHLLRLANEFFRRFGREIAA